MAKQPDPVQAALEQLNQIIANSGANLNPIGVPAGYKPDTGGRAAPDLYFEGDDWQPAGLPPEQIARLQQKLVEAKAIPRGAQYRVGVWDQVSRDAYRDILTFSNASGMNPEQALKTWASSTMEARSQQQLKVDAASMRASVRDHVSKLLGREVTDDEVPGLVGVRAGLGQQELDSQQSTADVVQAVDSDARFEDYLRDRYRPEIDRNRAVVDMSQSRENLLSNIFALDKEIG